MSNRSSSAGARLARFTAIVACAVPALACTSAGEPAPSEALGAERAAVVGGPPVCITIQRGASGAVADALIANADGAPDKNYGSSSSLSCSSGASGLRYALVRFDTSAIPADAVITSATAGLSVLLYGGAPVRAHRITAPWSELTVTLANFGAAFSPSVEAVFPTGSPTSASLTSLVQSWVNGSVENDGILLERDAGVTVFASSEYLASARPRLDVCYLPGPCSGQPDGAACNDGDACTQVDTCQAGACVGSNPVACAASDQCHVAGICDGATGVCSNPAVANGSACSDGDACTQGDTCQAGACAPGSAVVCAPLDACHAAGVCSPATGACAAGPPLLTTIAGNPTVTNAASAAALACIGAVTGTLTIAADASVPALSLPYLQSVGGLTVTSGSLATTISLAGLTTSGPLSVQQSPALTTLGLGALVNAYSVAIVADASLSSLDLSGLQTVTVDLSVTGTALASLGLGDLVSVGRTLSVTENPELATLGPTSLLHLASVGSAPYGGGTFFFQDNPLVTAVDASNAVLDGFWLSGNAALTSFRPGSLPPSVYVANITDSPLLTDLGPTGLSPIQSVTVDMIVGNTGLAGLGPTGLSNLVSVGRTLSVIENPELATLGPTSLLHLASVGSAPYGGGTFFFQDNPLVTAVDASNAVLDGFWLSGNAALTSFRPGSLPPSVYVANITDSPLLTDLGPTGLSPIQSVTVDMIVGNTGLAGLGPTGLSNLVSVGRTLSVIENPKLTTLGPTSLLHLASVGSAPYGGGTFFFESNPLVTAIDASNASLDGFSVSDNAALTSFRLGNLPPSVYIADITGSPLLTDLGPTGLSPIQTVTVDMVISDTGLAGLGPTGLSNLVSVGRTLSVTENPRLTTLGPTSLVHLASVGSAPYGGGTFFFESNPLVTAIDASNASLDGFSVTDNAALTSLRLGNLPPSVYVANITGSPLLTDLGPTGLSPIQSVTLDMAISNTGLAGLGPTGLSNLVSVGRSFSVTENPQLASLGPTGLAQLTSIGSPALGGGLDFETNPLVSKLDLSALTSVAGYLVVNSDAALAQLLLGSLVHVGGSLQIVNDPQLPTCFNALVAQLVGFGGAVTIASDGPACP